jgi:hypothetical protein
MKPDIVVPAAFAAAVIWARSAAFNLTGTASRREFGCGGRPIRAGFVLAVLGGVTAASYQ